MKTTTIFPSEQTTRVLIFEEGEEVMETLREFARSKDVRAAHFTAIGAFQTATLAYFDWETRDYVEIPVREQVEVLVLAGDIAWKDDEPVVHAHVVLGKRDGATLGGHLCTAIVRPTLELTLVEGGALVRSYDPRSGLALIKP